MRASRVVRGLPCAGLLATALALAALAGCGGGSTTTVTEERTVTEREPAPDDGTTSEGQTTEGTTTEGADSEAPAEFVELESFQSPSGNIGCFVIEGDARCDIGKHSWAAPRPADCPPEMEAGQGLMVGAAGEAGVVCAGDTARNAGAPILAYGTASEVGGTICVSRRSGITCTNSAGHGFTISAQSYDLF